jgi:hypothetical protein
MYPEDIRVNNLEAPATAPRPVSPREQQARKVLRADLGEGPLGNGWREFKKHDWYGWAGAEYGPDDAEPWICEYEPIFDIEEEGERELANWAPASYVVAIRDGGGDSGNILFHEMDTEGNTTRMFGRTFQGTPEQAWAQSGLVIAHLPPRPTPEVLVRVFGFREVP